MMDVKKPFLKPFLALRVKKSRFLFFFRNFFYVSKLSPFQLL